MTRHILQYNTHAEKRFFLGTQHRALYDLLALNGNIVSWSPAGTAAFLATAAKPFYIDPQTHAFQHPTRHLKRDVSDKKAGEPPRYEFKPSIIKLAQERLGTPFSDVIDSDRPLRPDVFLDEAGAPRDGILTEVCTAVGAFQKNLMREEMDEETLEYLDADELSPDFLIAPYFYLGPPLAEEWLKVTEAGYSMMRDMYADDDVYLALTLPKSILNNWGWLLPTLTDVRPNGVLLWIDEFNETELSAQDVTRYFEFLRELRGTTDALLIPHAGYLSTIACHGDLGPIADGVGHSPNYGEYRAVVPIGGGIPMARFYLQSLHSRLRHGDVAGLIQPLGWLESPEIYTEKVCGCLQCQALIQDEGSVDAAFAYYGASTPVTFTRRPGSVVRLNYPTTEAREAAARHYLFNKARELQDVENNDLNEILRRLDQAWDELQEEAGFETAGHTLAWSQGVHEFLGD